MAIKPCKECGAPVSDKAESCPMCGAKQPKATSVLTWVCVGILGLAAIIWMYSDKTPSASSGGVSTTQATESENVKPKNWQYKTTKDDMRGTTTNFATTVSTNTVNFDFPYNGGSKLLLTLRETGNQKDVIVTISKGQILCGIRGCDLSFKFNDGAVQSITMSEPDNHSSEALFVMYDKTEDKIISQIKSSKKLVVEVPFYQEGRKQFTFDVSGLEWN